MLLPLAAAGGKGGALPELTSRHTNASGTIRFRTPEDWRVETRPGIPEITEARGGQLLVRIVRREGEVGLDALHVDCMLLRLGDAMQSRPAVDYEYDFVGGTVEARRALDSAFVVHHDEPIDGAHDWWQRNVTVVGAGESVCLVGYGPRPELGRKKPLRRLMDAVLTSVEFRPWR